jgi:hypothetical protein
LEPPPIPEQPLQEGARWRHHKPSSEAVAEWFKNVPLDEGMSHDTFIGGVVIISQSEKVKHSTDAGTVERWEQTFTPYMQIGTRVAYFRLLAEHRGLIPVTEAVEVPRSKDPKSAYFNANMPPGLWWHVVTNSHGDAVRYLCATYRVAMYERASYAAKLKGEPDLPLLGGIGTKQVGGGPDDNGLMKAETGAIGRALGVAGILALGTGIATAEDMQEFVAQPQAAPPQLPASPSEIAQGDTPAPAQTPEERLAQLRSRAMALDTQLAEKDPARHAEHQAWWQERKNTEGWRTLGDVPVEALAGIVSRLQEMMQGQTAVAETADVQ